MHCLCIVSASTGEYLFDDIPFEKVQVPSNSPADFAVDIHGNSMEPSYFDGETVLVEKISILNIVEIGIFTINGVCYIKEYAKDRLISHNKDYRDILFDETMDIRIIGKVVGTL